MLVFISDIHLTDESAFSSHLPPEAFDGVFTSNLMSLLDRKENVEELILVLLGDFFDLVRTRTWIKITEGEWEPAQVNPWGEDTAALEEDASGVLRDVIEKNRPFLEAIRAFSERIRSQRPGMRFEILYVPGNHDRLVVKGSLKKQVEEALPGVKVAEDDFYLNPDYATLAFHGHQLDIMNRTANGVAPIGDYISSLVTALPCLIKTGMVKKGFSPTDADSLSRRMLQIDDVRPASATVPWLVSQTGTEEQKLRDFLRDFLLDAVVKVVEDPFFKRWMDAHDKELGTADKVLDSLVKLRVHRGVRWLARKCGSWCVSLERLSKIAQMGRSGTGQDKYADMLAGALGGTFTEKDSPFEWEVQRRLGGVRQIVMGHTHGAQYLPLSVNHAYLNTGTWRKYTTQSHRGQEFSFSQRLSFVAVYKPREAGNHRFEEWSAVLVRVE